MVEVDFIGLVLCTRIAGYGYKLAAELIHRQSKKCTVDEESVPDILVNLPRV